MICSTKLTCPYCGKCDVALDFEKHAIIVNPDLVDNTVCEHLMYAHFMASGMTVDDCWASRFLPDLSDCLDFCAEFCFTETCQDLVKSDFYVIEDSATYRLGKRTEWYEITDVPPDKSDIWLRATGLFAKDPEAFAIEILRIIFGPE